jgi:hypothetical protein
MSWVRDDDGLKLAGIPHYDPNHIQQLVEQLRQSRNQPEKVCELIEDVLATGKASKELVWRLSKWCHWDDSSERVARSLADQLFYGNICRRLRDKNDKPIPDRGTAEADYQKWLDDVVQISQGSQPSAVFPDEVATTEGYREGAVRSVRVNAYERNPEARARCITYYGSACFVCGFEFARAYDGVGKGFIHVHHLRELSNSGGEHDVDPIADMRPVCPNCHVIIHLYRQPFTIEEVKAMVARSRERTIATSQTK